MPEEEERVMPTPVRDRLGHEQERSMAKQDTASGAHGTRSTPMPDTKTRWRATCASASSRLAFTDKIFQVVVPTERTIKIKGGRRVEEEEKVYPGYVLVDMIVDDQSWYVVRNTPRVTGFVGSGVNPVPLRQDEVDTLLGRMQATSRGQR
jgi:hypothetical protein